MNSTEAIRQDAYDEALLRDDILIDISMRYINLSIDQVDGRIEEDLHQVCEALHLDFATLWQWSDNKQQNLLLSHLYSVPEGPSRPDRIDALVSFPWTVSKMLEGETLIVVTDDMVPEAARDQEIRRYYGTKSAVVVPMTVEGGRLLGVLSFDVLTDNFVWSTETVQRLQLVAQIFCSALVRKESEMKLRESERRLALAVDSASAGLWELDCDTNMFWTTEKALEIFGYDPEAKISLAHFETSILSADLGAVRQAIESSMKYDVLIDVQYRIRGDSNSLKWIHSRGQTYFKSNGEPDRILGTSTDITERKRAEEALQEREKKYRLLFERSNDAIFMVDTRTGKYLDANSAALELAGYSIKELTNLTTSDIFPERARNRLEKVRGADETQSLDEVVCLRKDGTTRYALLDWVPLGENVAFGIVRDITERKSREKSIIESEARLASAIDIAGIGFYEMDKSHCVNFLDNRIRDILGIMPEQEEEGRNFWLEHVHPENLSYVLEQSRQVLEEGKELFEDEYRYLHPERGAIWIHHQSRVIERTSAGKASYLIGVMRDISESKRLEESLRYSQRDLQKLAARLISVREKEFKGLARELHDDFTQRLAVLAIKLGKLEIQMGSGEADSHEVVQRMIEIKMEVIGISEDVHRISRQLHPTILDDLGLVRAIESECSAIMRREDLDIALSANIAERLPDDLSLCLYRIAQEGLHNVVKHSGVKRCEVDLQLVGSNINLTIKDEGRGFETVQVRDKAGLGLASMRERAQLVGGDFFIETEPGRGTIVHAILPLQRTE